jgi:hypothetical protein
LAGLLAHSAGMRPSLMSRFSPSVLRCLGAATIVASMICPPLARKPAADSAPSKRANRTSIAGLPSSRARVSASRKVQIVLASGRNYQEFRARPGGSTDYAIALVKRSPNRTANWALAMAHCFSDRFKTRKSSLVAASSLGKWPLARTARRSLELRASIAFVTGMKIAVPARPAGIG